jgi:hypothetical protein
MNFKTIIQSWIAAANPTEEQKTIAEKRYSICDMCPSKKTITSKLEIGVVCDECGCPINKKIFSPNFNECPLRKWEKVDDLYFPNRKVNKTLY